MSEVKSIFGEFKNLNAKNEEKVIRDLVEGNGDLFWNIKRYMSKEDKENQLDLFEFDPKEKDDVANYISPQQAGINKFKKYTKGLS